MRRTERHVLVRTAILFAVVMPVQACTTMVTRYVVREQMPLKPTSCVAPLWDFGVDSPAMRLFLVTHIPGVCFKSQMPAADSYCLEGHGRAAGTSERESTRDDGDFESRR